MSCRFPRLALLAAAVLVVPTACESGDPTQPTDVDPTAVSVTAPASTVESGATLQLAATVQPSGAPQAVTWSSGDPAVAEVNSSGLVEGLEPGTVVITATSTADASVRGSITLTVTCPAPRMVSSNVSGDTTWENWIASPSCFDYVVTVDLQLNDELLTIEPGTVVGFEAGTRLQLTGDAAGIHAPGRADEPIRLTGTESVRGHWEGVLLQNTEHPQNLMYNTTIEYAGAGAFGGGIRAANLMLHEGTEIDLLDLTLQESAGYGLYLHFRPTLARRLRSMLTRNALGPAYVHASLLHYLMDSGLSGNDRDVVDIVPNTVPEDPAHGLEWNGFGGARLRILQATNRLALQIEGTLTVTGGTVVEFEEDMAMLVHGALVAGGTAEEPVVFTGTEPRFGHWRGIVARGDVLLSLDRVVIEFGGRTNIGTVDDQPANLVLTTGAANTTTRARVTNTVLRGSAAYGFYARAVQVEIEEFSGNVLGGNELGAAYLDAPLVGRLGEGTYVGNDIERIHVETGSERPIASDATWRDHGAPYVMERRASRDLLIENATLTLEPGVEIRFGENYGVNVRFGRLVAVGTADDPITLTADGPVRWRGINIHDGEAEFEHVGILEGGSQGWSSATPAANVTILTANGNAPASTATFGPGVQTTGADWALAFGPGDTFATPCILPAFIPPGAAMGDHCH